MLISFIAYIHRRYRMHPSHNVIEKKTDRNGLQLFLSTVEPASPWKPRKTRRQVVKLSTCGNMFHFFNNETPLSLSVSFAVCNRAFLFGQKDLWHRHITTTTSHQPYHRGYCVWRPRQERNTRNLPNSFTEFAYNSIIHCGWIISCRAPPPKCIVFPGKT